MNYPINTLLMAPPPDGGGGGGGLVSTMLLLAVIGGLVYLIVRFVNKKTNVKVKKVKRPEGQNNPKT